MADDKKLKNASKQPTRETIPQLKELTDRLNKRSSGLLTLEAVSFLQQERGAFQKALQKAGEKDAKKLLDEIKDLLYGTDRDHKEGIWSGLASTVEPLLDAIQDVWKKAKGTV
jgi:phage-related minor tail protein